MAEPLHLLAAGSLSGPLAGIGPVAGRAVLARFGPSGLLREAVEDGAPWDVLVSADTGHPARLHRAGLSGPPRVFCANRLALILRPGIAGADAAALMERSDLRLGISTPGNDPSGDYAVQALARLGPAVLARARPLTGAPGLALAPPGRNPYAWLVTDGEADLMLTYRSNALAACRDTPGLRVLDLPAALQVRARYALCLRAGAGAQAQALVAHLLSSPVLGALQDHGFEPPSASDITEAAP
jgi:molybdenum ABC transporter molybdate-binding protein